MAGGVIIAPHLKRTKISIDANGNEVDPKTKQIIKYKEEEYKPSPEELAGKANLPAEPAKIPEAAKGPENPLSKMIQKKVEEAVAASLAKIDIAAMVEKAINDAFSK